MSSGIFAGISSGYDVTGDLLICGSPEITGYWILRARMNGFPRHFHVGSAFLSYVGRAMIKELAYDLGHYFSLQIPDNFPD